ncbi:MAG: hypothetical protein ACXVW7_12820 [Trebonia sp.]
MPSSIAASSLGGLLRVIRRALVPRELLGRVTAAYRLVVQVVTPVGAVLAGAVTGLLGGDPRPVSATAGGLSVLTVAVAWIAGLRREQARSRTDPVAATGS